MQASGIDRAQAAAPRQHGLDIVRAAAIASVMLYHAKTMSLFGSAAPWPVSFGWMGVDLFFVLSGFLIASQLLEPLANGRGPDYRRFFVRRALRTLPAFSMVLLLYFAVPQLRETPQIQPFLQFASFTENLLFRADAPKAFDQVWSLCVEEQFYLLLPLVIALVAIRPTATKIVGLLVATLLFGVIVRSLSWLSAANGSGAVDWQSYVTVIYYPTWGRLDGLLAGVALATLKMLRPANWQRFVARPNLLLAAGFAGIAGSIILFAGQIPAALWVTFGFPVLSTSIALVVAAASAGRGLIGGHRVPGATALAAGAYSLYLTHKLAFHATQAWIAPALGVSGPAVAGLAILVATGAGASLYLLIERPFLRLRNRLEAWPKPSPAIGLVKMPV